MASFGSNKQRQQQTSSSMGQSYVDPSQRGFFDWLRGQAQNTAESQMGAGGMGDVANQLSGQLGQAGQDFLGQLQGLAGTQELSGTGFLEQRLNQANPFLNQQIAQLGQDIGEQFQQSILPGIRGSAQQVGAYGGSRQGVAEGLAAQGAQDAFAQQAANLRFQDVGLRQAAAGQLQSAGLQQQGLQAAAANTGLGNLGGLMNLGMSPFGAQFGPLAQFAQLLGPANILNRTQSYGQSTGQSGGYNFGLG